MKRPGADQRSSPSDSEEDRLDENRARADFTPTAEADSPSPVGDEIDGDIRDGDLDITNEPATDKAASASEENVADVGEGGEVPEQPVEELPDRDVGRSRATGEPVLPGGLRRAGTAIRAGAARRRRILLASIATVAVLLLATSAVLYLAVVRPEQQAEQARVDGLTAARGAVEQILTYQPASQGPDLERARGLVTGDFGNQFEMVLNTVVRPALKGGVGTRTVVTRAGVVSADTDRVTALLYLTQQASRADEPPRTNAGRAEVTVQRVDGRWLVSDLRNF